MPETSVVELVKSIGPLALNTVLMIGLVVVWRKLEAQEEKYMAALTNKMEGYQGDLNEHIKSSHERTTKVAILEAFMSELKSQLTRLDEKLDLIIRNGNGAYRYSKPRRLGR